MHADSNDHNLARLCDLQQRQLEKLDEISRQLAESTEATKRSHEEYAQHRIAYEKSHSEYQSWAEAAKRSQEEYVRQGIAYEKSHSEYQSWSEAAKRSQEEYVRQGIVYDKALSEYQSSDRLVAKIVTWRAILISLMLGLIAVAIFIQ